LKKILITGGCGFIGSHLVEFFIKKKFKVIVLDKKGKRFSPNWLKNNKDKNLKLHLDNIVNKNTVNKLVKNSDYVIHLAALISIPHSYIKPKEHLKTNIIGTFNILEACKKYTKNCIITSSSETYGSGKIFPMSEKHPLSAQSPYAATKIGADQIALSYNKSFDLKVKIIRPFNCFGPRQSTRAVIPTIITQMLNNKHVVKIGNSETYRDYTYVEDLCNAYWLLFKSDKGFGQVFNVGTKKTHKIKNIFHILKKKLGYKGHLKAENKRVRPKKSEVDKLLCDNRLFVKQFKWKHKSFEKSIFKTFEWYKKNTKIFKDIEYKI
jgi:dTDP-glucose 4,6-dehydratase